MADKVFVNGRSAVHAGSAGQSTAFPDVNLCPPSPPAGPVPTPLPNTALGADLQGGASSVLIEGHPMGKRSSFLGQSTGNEIARATGGGVVSHVVQGQAYFASYSLDVTIEGEEAVRHLDLMTHNHAAPTPPNAAMGTYLGAMSPAAVGAADPPPKERTGARTKQPQTVEIFLDHLSGRAAGGVDTISLVSVDGRYSQSLAPSAGAAKGGLLCLRFTNVLPGRAYSLYRVVGGEKIPFFENVPFARIAEHSPGAERPPPARGGKKLPADQERPDEPEGPPLSAIDHPDDWYERPGPGK